MNYLAHRLPYVPNKRLRYMRIGYAREIKHGTETDARNGQGGGCA